MSKYPKHHIRTVEDFLKIPKEKLAHCLQDFQNWIKFSTSEELAMLLKEIPGMKTDFSTFIWVDDGRHEIIPRIEVVEDAGKEP